MTTEEDFQKALDAQPDDWQLRLVFADWLDERGDPRAEGYRALGTLRVWPFLWRYPPDPPDVYRWCYHNGEGNENGRPIPQCHVLPQGWINAICAHARVIRVAVVIESDIGVPAPAPRSVMEDAAARGFARLSPRRRKALLSGAPARPGG